jgi:hypothetical protein
MPLDFLRSRAWAELSPHAAKMLLDLCAGLGPNAKGNGDLSAAPVVMRPKGWSSTATRVAALQELERVGLIAVMRPGNRRSCTLYAITLWPLQCDLAKLDYGPGAYTTSDWQRNAPNRADRPTMDAPANWRPLRERTKSVPAEGIAARDVLPLRDKAANVNRRSIPGAGTTEAISKAEVFPLRDTFLELPSGACSLGARAR